MLDIIHKSLHLFLLDFSGQAQENCVIEFTQLVPINISSSLTFIFQSFILVQYLGKNRLLFVEVTFHRKNKVD